MTKIHKCSCKHSYQDNRVFNVIKKDANKPAILRCTVCKNEEKTNL